MEDRRVIGIGDLKERIEGIISKFDCVYNYEAFLEDTPLRVIAYINPRLSPYGEVVRFLNFIGDDENRVNCTLVGTGEIKSFNEGFNSGKEFQYLIGLEELKRILALSYDLPKDSYIDDISKIHDEIHIIIKDKYKEQIYS